MSEKITVTYLRGNLTNFRYLFFYSERVRLSFYSEFFADNEGYKKRMFEVGRGKEFF